MYRGLVLANHRCTKYEAGKLEIEKEKKEEIGPAVFLLHIPVLAVIRWGDAIEACVRAIVKILAKEDLAI